MLSLTKKLRRLPNHVVGFELHEHGFAFAIKKNTGENAFITQMGFVEERLENTSQTEKKGHLGRFIEEHDLKNSTCHLVLSGNDYQMLLAEAPDVPDEELRDAIRWRVKDLISQPIEKMAIDVFLLSKEGARAGKKMAYVVAAEAAKLKSLIDSICHHKLNLKSIDIGELALRNLVVMTEEGREDGRGVGIVRLRKNGGTVCLYRQGDLYLSRQFRIPYNAGLLDDLPIDELTLEVQRSLDYYERQMGLSLPQVLYLCGENVSEDKLTSSLKQAFPLPVKLLKPDGLCALEYGVADDILQTCIGALGAVMRDEVAV